jgi:hypothetical protein
MKRPIEPSPSQGRTRYPDAGLEALAWIVEKAREIVRDGQGGDIDWEWGSGDDDDDFELDPENNGPVARVFDANGDTVVIVTEGD